MDYSLPYVNSIPAFLFTIIIVSYYFSRRWRPAKLAPTEAKGAWPIFGHLPLLGGSTPPHITLAAMADQYGPLFTIRLGVHPSLVISSSEIAKECFTTNDLSLNSRPKLAVVDHIGYNYAMFGFAPSGPFWREMRKITTLELLSNRRLELLRHIRVSEVTTFLQDLYKTWSTAERGESNNSDGVLVELKQWFEDMTLNVILRMVAGKRYSVAADEDEKKEARKVQSALREFFYYVGLFVVGDSVPYLRWLDLGGHEKAMKKTAKELDAIVGGWVEEHKKRRARGDAKGEPDFIDAMLSVLDGADLGGFDADTVNKATSLNMIAGGSDTTMVTLTWAISLLLNNPHVLKRAQNELDTEIGRHRVVSDSDISKLVYLQAIVKETLRLYPAAPLSGPREFTEDCVIGGYHVSKGTRLITNLRKIQTDPRIWPDPFEFKPERFLTTHKDVDVKGLHFELIPFGSGRRACPGLAFGLQMVQFTLASFVHAFEISNPSSAPIDMSESFGLTNVKATPLQVRIKPRLPSQLYG
ncbi:cytochrome P450 CYP82D47 [Prunus yedoensis var. nudiflora]|uniref:Cytochrome P450 CYP82D47 n=1 Tax=Prunus yedoensis var. nudiflora TaxID=2094558 RepID=A0A314UWW8_PRUYE|nr:cytochrome P450 CYP82D47 [Prunus yedoensis var. nudiflora]